MAFPAPQDPCQRCAAAIEEPRVAVGLTSCWRCGPSDPASPPWDIVPTGEPVWAGYDPGIDLQ